MPGSSLIAASLGQARGVTGIDFSQNGYHAKVTVGSDEFTYAGGYPGAEVNNGSSPSASASIDVNLDSQWTLHASDNHGYALQTFLQAYGPQAPDVVTPNEAITTSEASLDFDSLQRFRASLTALRSQDASGQQTSSAGGSLAWQISPQLSVRTWLLHEQSTTALPQMVGSTWFTYQTPGLRIDAIWRRDLLDGAPDAHVDGSISGPLSNRLSWFVATESRVKIRATDVGIRF
jgi:hypothetical protein